MKNTHFADELRSYMTHLSSKPSLKLTLMNMLDSTPEDLLASLLKRR